jgi:hypothetical protein
MRGGELLGVDRRRRWTDEVKISLQEVGQNGWSVTDVARRHDLTRQHIYALNGARINADADETYAFITGLHENGTFELRRLCEWLRANITNERS